MISIGSTVEIVAIGKDDSHYGNKSLIGARGKIVKPCKGKPGGMFACDIKLEGKPHLKNNCVFLSVRLKEIK